METEAIISFIADELLTPLHQTVPEIINEPEEEEDGSAVADPIYIVIVIHVGLDGIDEAWMQLFSLVKDEQSLGAAQHHVSDGFSQLSLGSKKNTKLKVKLTINVSDQKFKLKVDYLQSSFVYKDI